MGKAMLKRDGSPSHSVNLHPRRLYISIASAFVFTTVAMTSFIPTRRQSSKTRSMSLSPHPCPRRDESTAKEEKYAAFFSMSFA